MIGIFESDIYYFAFRDYEAETEQEENAFNAKIKMQLEELLTKLEALIIEKKHMFRGGYAFL